MALDTTGSGRSVLKQTEGQRTAHAATRTAQLKDCTTTLFVSVLTLTLRSDEDAEVLSQQR